jgi:hypothetical protein
MPSALPTENTLDKAVNTFGIGTYDSQRDENAEHGEDSEKKDPTGETLPQAGGPLDPFGPDRLLSYPQEYTSQNKHSSVNEFVNSMLNLAAAMMPGEIDRPAQRRRVNDDTLQSVVESVSQAKLPSDGGPPARSDYYDKMQTGKANKTRMKGHITDIWPDEDSGAYANEEKISDSKLPGGSDKNEMSMDDTLSTLGNYWSGYEIEDMSGSQGFPTEDFSENINIDRSDNQDGGRILASRYGDQFDMEHTRIATDIPLVVELTKEFIKEFGKKDLTRRHVMAFLHDRGRPQYLASDIIRCLKHNHKLVVPDVLDVFPISKTVKNVREFSKIASNNNIVNARNKLIDLQLENILDTKASVAFGKCAANLTYVMAVLEKLEGHNG